MAVETDATTKNLTNSVISSLDKESIGLRLKLVEVCRAMTRDDLYYLHHQMKRILPSLKEEIRNPYYIFDMLIKEGLLTPHDLTVIIQAFRRMKRHSLIALLNQAEIGKDSRERRNSVSKSEPKNPLKTIDFPLTDQFILRLCTEEVGPNELMELGVKGFKLSIAAIRRAQFDHRSTLDASIAVFTEWKNQAPFPNATSWTPGETVPPFSMRGLGQALKDSNLNHTYRKYCM